MNDETLQAFLDELEEMEKDASVGSAVMGAAKWLRARPSVAAGWLKRAPGAAADWAKKQPGQFVDAGKRMLHPIKSTKAGWRHMTPSKQLEHLRAQPLTAENAAKIEKYTEGMGKHITEGTRAGAGRLERIADAMSRAGWSGKGDVGKYIPGFSQKGMYAGFGGLSAAEIARAAKKDPSRTGSGGLFETGLGEGLGTAAMIAATGGLGMLPATAMWAGGQFLGSRAGRVADRLRGGADLRTAALAPTPEKAHRMIQNLKSQSPEEQQKTIATLQRYYG